MTAEFIIGNYLHARACIYVFRAASAGIRRANRTGGFRAAASDDGTVRASTRRQ